MHAQQKSILAIRFAVYKYYIITTIFLTPNSILLLLYIHKYTYIYIYIYMSKAIAQVIFIVVPHLNRMSIRIDLLRFAQCETDNDDITRAKLRIFPFASFHVRPNRLVYQNIILKLIHYFLLVILHHRIHASSIFYSYFFVVSFYSCCVAVSGCETSATTTNLIFHPR